MMTSNPVISQQPIFTEARVFLNNISWQTYQSLMTDIGENRSCRITYERSAVRLFKQKIQAILQNQ